MPDHDYVVCSNPKCKFSHHDVITFKFCPDCGAQTIGQCPECGAYLQRKGQRFCHNCAAPIRPSSDATE